MITPIKYVLILLLLSCGCLSCSKKEANSFPDIRAGVYDGVFSFSRLDSLGPLSGKTIGVFLEKSEGASAVQASVFYQGQRSASYPLIPLDPPLEKKFKPLRFEVAQKSLSLFAEKSEKAKGEYSGVIASEKGEPFGEWRVFPSKQESLGASSSGYMNYQIDSKEFNAWLTLQARYQVALGRLRVASEASMRLEKEVAVLQKSVDSPEDLQSRSVAKLKEFKVELASKQEEISKLDARIEKGLKGIKQAQRITKLGRSLELSRRVASRESQWYQVNWGDGRSDESMESKIARKMNIDLRLLDSKSTQALEIQRLRSQIAAEKAKIRNLKKQRKRQAEDAERKKKQPWWQRWDTVIG